MKWFDAIVEEIKRPFLYFFLSDQRIYWLYLLTALICAFGVYAYSISNRRQISLKEFLAFCFPKAIYFHKSALLDYAYFIINRILFALLFIPFLGLIYPYLTKFISSGLSQTFGEIGWKVESPIAFNLCFTIISVLAIDLGVFLAHYLQHKVPFFWEFHKVHHSAEVMTPVTVYRMHPVDDVLGFAISSAVAALVGGVFSYLCGNNVTSYTFLGVNAIMFTFYLCGYNLRHSHVWLSFGARLERVFISPALHQIHHSTNPKHFDKNMGLIFSIWDRLFNTLYIPEKKEDLTFGLGDKETKEYSSVLKFYILPFFKNTKSFSRSIFVLIIIAGGIFAGTYSLKTYFGPWLERSRTTVFLEDLTSPEVAHLIRDGYTTVLIPTGGVEQNGPHMILGKHNYIVKFTCEEIARRVGSTLVAPTLPYVPQGSITPPSGHMRHSGTISIPNQVFEGVLEHSARSLKAHGFKSIYFIGDSGDSQAGQKNVMNKLNKEWASDGSRVYSVSHYYFKNKQKDFLTKQGETPETIGSHAGIRDTSELLYVYPKGIRKDTIERYDPKYQRRGYSGAIDRASAKRGEDLLELKIKVAVKQIKALQKRHPR